MEGEGDGSRELALLDTLAPDAWNASHAPSVAYPAWTVSAPVRRYAVPVDDDASVDALGAVDVECVSAPARVGVLFGDRLVWSGVATPSRPRLTCGSFNLVRARALGRGVQILVVAPHDAHVRVTATLRRRSGREREREWGAAYEGRGLFIMDV